MRGIRLHWDAEQGWLLDVPFMLSKPMFARAIEWSVPRQVDRLRSLPPNTDKHRELKAAIEELRAGKVCQNVVGARGDGKGDIVSFQAKRPEGPQPYSFGS
jgi:hypothetical protein